MKPTIWVIAPWDRFWSLGKDAGTGAFYYALSALTSAFDVILWAPLNQIPDSLSVNLIPIKFKLQRLPKYFLPIESLYNQYLLIKAFLNTYRTELAANPACIYGFSLYTAPLLVWLRFKTKAPTVLRLFGVYRLAEGLKNPLVALGYAIEYLSFFLPQNIRIISDDGSGGDKLIQYFKLNPKTNLCWFDGVEGIEYKPIPVSNHILWAGRIVNYRHPERLLFALKNARSNWAATICGDGPYLESLKQLATKLQLNDKVTFTGVISNEQVNSLLDSAKIAISTSNNFNTTNFILNAMSKGKIILTMNQGNSSILIHQQNCLKASNSKELARCLDFLANHPDIADQLSNNASQTALLHLAPWHKRLTHESDLISTLINRQRI